MFTVLAILIALYWWQRCRTAERELAAFHVRNPSAAVTQTWAVTVKGRSTPMYVAADSEANAIKGALGMRIDPKAIVDVSPLAKKN